MEKNLTGESNDKLLIWRITLARGVFSHPQSITPGLKTPGKCIPGSLGGGSVIKHELVVISFQWVD